MQKAVALLVCLSLWTALALTAASKSFSSRELLSAVMFSFPVSVCYSFFLDSLLWCSSKTRLKLRWQTFNQKISIFLKFLKFPGDKWRCHQSLQLQSQVSANTSAHPQNLPLVLFVPVLFMSFITLLKSPSVRELTYTFILKKLRRRRYRYRNLHKVTSVHPLLLSLLARASTLNSDS